MASESPIPWYSTTAGYQEATRVTLEGTFMGSRFWRMFRHLMKKRPARTGSRRLARRIAAVRTRGPRCGTIELLSKRFDSGGMAVVGDCRPAGRNSELAQPRSKGGPVDAEDSRSLGEVVGGVTEDVSK